MRRAPGDRFGRLVLMSQAASDLRGRTRWLCRCDCGQAKEIRLSHLTQGRILSCGCLQRAGRLRRGGNASGVSIVEHI